MLFRSSLRSGYSPERAEGVTAKGVRCCLSFGEIDGFVRISIRESLASVERQVDDLEALKARLTIATPTHLLVTALEIVADVFSDEFTCHRADLVDGDIPYPELLAQVEPTAPGIASLAVVDTFARIEVGGGVPIFVEGAKKADLISFHASISLEDCFLNRLIGTLCLLT